MAANAGGRPRRGIPQPEEMKKWMALFVKPSSQIDYYDDALSFLMRVKHLVDNKTDLATFLTTYPDRVVVEHFIQNDDDTRTPLEPAAQLVQMNGLAVVRGALDVGFIDLLVVSKLPLFLPDAEIIFNETDGPEEAANPPRVQFHMLAEGSHGEVGALYHGPDLILQAALLDAKNRMLLAAHQNLLRRVVLRSKDHCKEQLCHTDYKEVALEKHAKDVADIIAAAEAAEEEVDAEQAFPLSLLVCLMPGGRLSMPGGVPDLTMDAGDYVVFGPKFRHAGSAYDKMHFRLFSYIGCRGHIIDNMTNIVANEADDAADAADDGAPAPAAAPVEENEQTGHGGRAKGGAKQPTAAKAASAVRKPGPEGRGKGKGQGRGK